MSDLAHRVLRAAFQRAVADVRWLLDDVAEDDCFWEPTTPCWSVRRRGDIPRGWGRGDWVVEDFWPPPDPLPVTSIAWRCAHLGAWTDIYRGFAFEGERPDLMDMEVPGSRDGLVAWVHESQDRFGARLDETTPDQLAEPRPAHWGAEVPLHQLVATITYEQVHHGAEIGLLRDLRRGHARLQPPPPS